MGDSGLCDVMYTDGELSHGKPGDAKVAGFTASWSLVWVPDLRGCEMRDARCELLTLQLTKHQNRNN